MKKVLIIANYKGSIGGISGQVEVLRDNLNSEGLQCGKWKEESGKSSIEDRRLGIGDCPYHADIFSTQGNVVKRVWKFVELLIVARKYDVLHIHGCSERGMLPIVCGVIAGKIWRKRIIVTYHGGDAGKYFAKRGDFARRWLRRADKVIVLNGYLEKVFTKYDIPCIVIPNCITLSGAQEHSAYQWDAPRFISVRHLRELYNIPCILKAFAKVQEQVPGATLTILGSGPQLEELQEWVKKKVESGKLKEESVKFVGQVANSEMPKYLAESDIMLSAPRIDNMPVSVLEAMNAGVLVISSNVGGVPYMIEHGRTGLLFDLIENKNNKNIDKNNENNIIGNQKKYKENTEESSVTDSASTMLTPQSACMQASRQTDDTSCSTNTINQCLSDDSSEKNTKNISFDPADALAEQMMWAVEHRKECLRMIESAKQDVQKYSWEKIRNQLLPLYE